MARMERAEGSGDLIAQRETMAVRYFEPQLVKLHLTMEEIDRFDTAALRQALDRVNDAIVHPQQFGVLHLKATAGAGLVVAKVHQEAHVEVGILPLLLERKQRILDRLRVQVGQEQVTTLKELAAEVADVQVRESLDRELSALERSARHLEIERQTAELQQRAEEQRVAIEIQRKKFEVETFERRSAARRQWLERESITSVIGFVVLLVLVVAFVLAMFTKTAIPEALSSAFLLVLGYFFGQAATKAPQRVSGPSTSSGD